MDQAHSRALAALQPFIHLAITTTQPTPRFLADLITRATSSPGTYIFTELLQIPAIQSLRSVETPSEFQLYLTLLELFSYGTYDEYKSEYIKFNSVTLTDHAKGTPSLPLLNEAQTFKLRQLSLLTIASSPIPLTYANLISALSLGSAISLETLLTQSIYSGLLTARLSPTTTPPTVHITSVAPLRDLRPQSLPQMLATLQVWESRCSSVISELEGQIQDIRDAALKRQLAQKKREAIVDAAVLSSENDGGGLKGSGGVIINTGSRTTRSGGFDKSSPPEETRGSFRGVRGSGNVGSKRDLDEQQEDDEEADVEVGVAKMEVDEGATGSRRLKRVFGKKGGKD